MIPSCAAVAQRTTEVGALRTLGFTRLAILQTFLFESMMLGASAARCFLISPYLGTIRSVLLDYPHFTGGCCMTKARVLLAVVACGAVMAVGPVGTALAGNAHVKETIAHAKEAIAHEKEAIVHLEESVKASVDAHAKEALEHAKEAVKHAEEALMHAEQAEKPAKGKKSK